jgi:hypothetical protein
VREGSIGGGPDSSTCRSLSSASKTQDFALGPELAASPLRPLDCSGLAFDPGPQAHGVAAAPHLHAQCAVLDARGELPFDRDRAGPGQDRSRQRDLSRAPGHLELHAGPDEERDAVDHAPEDL